MDANYREFLDVLAMFEDAENEGHYIARQLPRSSIVKQRIRQMVTDEELSPVALFLAGAAKCAGESYGVLLELIRDGRGELRNVPQE